MSVKTTKCTHCGLSKHPLSDFYNSFSVLYEATGKMPVCKDCIPKLYAEALKEVNNDHRLALYHICRLFDYVFTEIIYNTVDKEENGLNICNKYIAKIVSLKQYKDKVFADSDILESKDNIEIQVVLDNDFEITPEMRNRWGKNIQPEEYEYLEEQYNTMLPRADSGDGVQVMYLKDISKLRLEAEKALSKGKITDYNNLMKTVSTLMGEAKLKPAQDETDFSKLAIGERIAMIENDEPIPEPEGVFKDVDGISKYITKWFTQQIGTMLGTIKKDDYDPTKDGENQ